MTGRSPGGTPGALRPILHRTFRASPELRLVRHGDLSREERRTFAPLRRDPEHWGVLVPCPGSSLGVQAVDRAGARLLRGLREPGPLPPSIRGGGTPGTDRRIARLVMDGILEIEAGGRFVTGPASHAELLHEPLRPARPSGPLARLSYVALRQAEVLPEPAPDRLRSWLYAFGTLPVGPLRARHFAAADAVARWVGLDGSGPAARRLGLHYRSGASPGWRSWQHRRVRLDPDDDSPTWKLYLSCRPDALPGVVDAFVTAAVEEELAAFKMGRELHGILRPDKLVGYFDRWEELRRFWERLGPAVEGAAAHGVPFTAALDDAGLASWGMDPPKARRIPGWPGSESWRVWITERIARALLRARRVVGGDAVGTETPDRVQALDGPTASPLAHALDRLRLEGIDVDTWAPPPGLWWEEEGGRA